MSAPKEKEDEMSLDLKKWVEMGVKLAQ